MLNLEKEKISAEYIQSTHNPESHYCNKGGDKVKYNSINVTETYNKSTEKAPKLNLISEVEVKLVKASISIFVPNATVNSQNIITDVIVNFMLMIPITVPRIKIFCKDKDIDLILKELQDAEG